MPLFIFFVNRPLTLIPYILGLILIVFVSMKQMETFPFIIIFMAFCFSSCYSLILIRYYLLGCSKSELIGLSVRKLKIIFNCTIFVQALGVIGSLIAFYKIPDAPMLIFIPTLITFASLKILECIIKAKLVTEAVKRNTTLKDIQFNDIYMELRKLALKKLIRN